MPNGSSDHDDGTRWCLTCFRSVYWHAVAERWAHNNTHTPRCHTGGELRLAPEGTRGAIRTRRGITR